MRLIFAVLLVISLVFFNFDYIQNVYLKNQLTHTGFIVNGSIVGLFLLGMIKLVTSLLFYWREERAVEKFIVNVHRDNFNPAESINKKSMIYRRYMTMQEIYRQHSPVNQNALAATMVASESTRLSLPKFISNILILMGVFGTIISLSIALIKGAIFIKFGRAPTTDRIFITIFKVNECFCKLMFNYLFVM